MRSAVAILALAFLEHLPFSRSGYISLGGASEPVNPRGLKPAARYTITKTSLEAPGLPAAERSPEMLIRAVPRDAVAAYILRVKEPEETPGQTTSALAVAGFLADRAAEMGLLHTLDATTRARIDLLGGASVLMQYPHALTVLSVEVDPRADGGHQLAGLNLALVIQAGSRSIEPVKGRIQRLLNALANDTFSTMERRSTGPQGVVVYSLRDRRLPEWAVIEWAGAADYYIVTLGRGVIDRTVALIQGPSSSNGDEAWFDRACVAAGAENAEFIAYAGFKSLRSTSDASLRDKINGVQEALGLGGVEQAMFTFSYRGRAAEIEGVISRFGRDESIALTVPVADDAAASSIVPPAAEHYAVLDVEPSTLLRAVRNGYLASRGPISGQRIRSRWGRVEADSGVCFERDVFGRLASPIIIHDYPRHPFHLPLMRTIVAPVAGDPAALGEAIERAGEYVQSRYPDAAMMRVRREPDGTWALDLGLLAPAVKVCGQWLVISHSPSALRRTADFLPIYSAPVNQCR